MDRRMNYLNGPDQILWAREIFTPLEGDELFSHRATSLVKAITQHPQPPYLIMSSAPNTAPTGVMNVNRVAAAVARAAAGETVPANNYWHFI